LWSATDAIRAAGLAHADVDRLLDALDHYRQRANLGLELVDALGLRPAPDQRPWHAVRPAERRDELFAQLASCFSGSANAVAQQILAASSRYASRTWPRARNAGVTPRDRVEALLHELHQVAELGGPRWPLAERQLRTRVGNFLGKTGDETANPPAVASTSNRRMTT
jgi:hypothetical protein